MRNEAYETLLRWSIFPLSCISCPCVMYAILCILLAIGRYSFDYGY